jgi:hypothetical protein
MVRQELPKLLTWVRFLHSVFTLLAQSGLEQIATNNEVRGSNPLESVDYSTYNIL